MRTFKEILQESSYDGLADNVYIGHNRGQLKPMQVGFFEAKQWNDEGYLYSLSSYDRDVAKSEIAKLKPMQVILRYDTTATRAGGIKPFIKLDLSNGKAFFMTEDAKDNDIVEFERRAQKAKYIRLSEEYAKEIKII